MLRSRSEPMQSNITACSTGQSANHLHHRGDELLCAHGNVWERDKVPEKNYVLEKLINKLIARSGN